MTKFHTIMRQKFLGDLTLFRMGLFTDGGGGGGGGQKCPQPQKPLYLKAVTYILQWWNLEELHFTLRRPKKYMNHVTNPLSSAEIRIFYQKLATCLRWRNTDKDCILIQRFVWVFKNCYNKHDCNFDDVSKIGYSRSS